MKHEKTKIRNLLRIKETRWDYIRYTRKAEKKRGLFRILKFCTIFFDAKRIMGKKTRKLI